MIGVRIEICGSDIFQFLNVVENSINWCIDIKSRLFDHILTLGNHLRCYFAIGIEDILNDEINGLLDGVGIMIAQGSDALQFVRCDDFLL